MTTEHLDGRSCSAQPLTQQHVGRRGVCLQWSSRAVEQLPVPFNSEAVCGRQHCVESSGISRIWVLWPRAVWPRGRHVTPAGGCSLLCNVGTRPGVSTGRHPAAAGRRPLLGGWKVLLNAHCNSERLKGFARTWVGNVASFPKKEEEEEDSKRDSNRQGCVFPGGPFQNLVFGRW